MSIKLTDIFTEKNVNKLFAVKKDFFKHFSNAHLDFIKSSIKKVQTCCDLAYAKATFTCPLCGVEDYRPVSCKSKFCSSCGKIYAEKWALKLSKDLIDEKHRHIIFTIPDILWRYSAFKRNILVVLSNHINQLFKTGSIKIILNIMD